MFRPRTSDYGRLSKSQSSENWAANYQVSRRELKLQQKIRFTSAFFCPQAGAAIGSETSSMIRCVLRFVTRCLRRPESGADAGATKSGDTSQGRIVSLGSTRPRNWQTQDESAELISERHIRAFSSIARPAVRIVVRAFADGTTVQVFHLRKALSVTD